MDGTRARQWLPSALVVVAGVAIVVPGPLTAGTVVVGAVLLVLAWVLSPWFFPRPKPDDVSRELAASRDVPLIYWRPGCSYCLRLRLALGPAGNRAVWVDVSRSASASKRVREVNGGDETVPTVFAGPTAEVNPSPGRMREQLRRQDLVGASASATAGGATGVFTTMSPGARHPPTRT